MQSDFNDYRDRFDWVEAPAFWPADRYRRERRLRRNGRFMMVDRWRAHSRPGEFTAS